MKVESCLGFPSGWKIGCWPIHVELIDEEEADDREIQGDFTEETLRCRISRGLEIPKAVEILQHEQLHGIWAERGLGDRAGEERAVEQLSRGLVAFATDNPGVALWMLCALVGKAKVVDLLEGIA